MISQTLGNAITSLSYALGDDGYTKSDRSQLLPDLDIDLLVRCILKPSVIEARQEFIKGI
jgi:hypothetical protein